jgi:O-6-methylguanine DNA methyltransferase
VAVWTFQRFPFGIGLFLAAEDRALRRASFAANADATPADWPRQWTHDPNDPVLAEAAQQLNEYFAHQREAFTVPLRPQGTPFQLRVWRALGEIPYGRTRTYLDLARALGSPGAVRAVGAANARNPLPIFVPCHRVIGSSGSLTGYGGGLEIKRALLQLEGVLLPI